MAALITLGLVSGCGGGDGAASTEASATIGPAGGTLTGPDGVQVVIPPGALDRPTEIGISSDGSGASAIGGLRPISKVFAATPHGTQFAVGTRISLPFDPANVPAGARPVVVRSDPGGTWTALASDVSGAMVSADISGFSYYAVGTCFTSRDRLVGGPDPTLACPSAGNLTLRLQDGNGNSLPVPRTPSGTALPAITVTTATQLQFTVEYNRPPSITRGELLSVWAYGAGLSPAQQPLTAFEFQNFRPATFLQINPATVPGAGRPGGVVVRVKAWVEYTTDAFYLGCLCFKPASWTFEAEVPLRVIYTTPVTQQPQPQPVASYTVGGSISGLTGAGLVLRNNAVDNLSVAANATAFTFVTRVNSGSAYDVTVQTQPTGQTCSVLNSSGTASAVVSNVAVACATNAVITLASATNAGGVPNNISLTPSLSSNGRRIAFTSRGNDLVAGYAFQDGAYVRDLDAGTTELITRTPTGGASSGGAGTFVKISGNGRYVIFTSSAPDLVPGDTNGSGGTNGGGDVFVRDLQAGTTVRVNVLPDGSQHGNVGDLYDDWVDISDDGRFALFRSTVDLTGTGSMPPATPGVAGARWFVRNLTSATTTAISAFDNTRFSNNRRAALSGDGRHVAMLDVDAGGAYRVRVFDPVLGARTVLTIAGIDGYVDDSIPLALSQDGRYVAFSFKSRTLLAGAAASAQQVGVIDTQASNPATTLELVSRTASGLPGNSYSSGPGISADGRYVVR